MLFPRSLLFFGFVVSASTTATADQQHSEDPGFVCVGLDWWPAQKCNYDWCPWHNSSVWAIDLAEVKTYARLLGSPSFLLRVGGTLQDSYVFKSDCSGSPQFPVDEDSQTGFGKGCITQQRIKEISDFCLEVGCKLVRFIVFFSSCFVRSASHKFTFSGVGFECHVWSKRQQWRLGFYQCGGTVEVLPFYQSSAPCCYLGQRSMGSDGQLEN